MGFSVSNGQIIGPNGQPFIAGGVDIWSNEVINDPTGSANLIESLFPNANMVRIAAGDGYSTDSVAALEPFINLMTSKGVVVEIGNYNPALTTNVATGQALTDELAWYTSLATAFKGNPYVWFSTDNEPSDQYTYGGATSAEQLAVYNAIRATGNTSMIGLENSQWSTGGQQEFSASISASDIAGMTNVHWDDHYYNWLSGYSADVGANLSALQSEVAGSQAYQSADGVIPVIIGEYGPATTGNGTDPGATATITAVLESGYGSTAWGINSGGTGDQLVAGSSLTAFGQQVAAAETSPLAPPAPPASVLPPSPNGTKITTASGTPIIDAAGRSWTLVQSATQGLQTAINGTVDTSTANVVLLETLNGNMVQENSAGNWYSEPGTGGAWTQIAAPAAPPAPSLSGTEITAASAKPIIDESGNAWTLVQSATNGLQIAVNGTVDTPTANVVLLETLNGAMDQENAAGNWYSETMPNDSWALIANPNPPTHPPTTSANGTSITTASASPIIDKSGNAWTLVQSATSGLQIAVNGTVDTPTANVVLLETLNSAIVQENSVGNWYSETTPNDSWAQLAGNPNPPPPPPPAFPSATDFFVTVGAGTFTTAGNTYDVDGGGNAIENGKAILGGSGTSAMAEFNGTLLGQDAGTGTWYTWNQQSWQPYAASVTDVTSAGTLTKSLSVTGTSQENGDTVVLSKGNEASAVLGAGNDNMAFIGASAVTVAGGSGSSQVLLAGGGNTITAGTGSLDVTAGGGADAYVFHAGDGLLTIEDFSVAKGDTLTVDKALQGSMTAESDGHGGAALVFGTNSAIDVKGVTTAPSVHYA